MLFGNCWKTAMEMKKYRSSTKSSTNELIVFDFWNSSKPYQTECELKWCLVESL
jgi:hypothetical protein